ncbi:glycohydrolase toxin TNT-related protein [Actinosynnema sp. NPDC091369]
MTASSLTGMPVESLPANGPVTMPEQRGPATAAPPPMPSPQPGGFGPQPGGFGPQPGGPAPAGPPPAGPPPARPDASAPTRAPEPAARPVASPPTAPIRTDGPAPAARGGDGPTPTADGPKADSTPTHSTPTDSTPTDSTPADNAPAGSTPPDATPAADGPDGPATTETPVDLVGEAGDEHSPASSHEWPADTTPGTTADADTGAKADADPFPHKNVWNQPAGVVPGFSHDGDYVPVHESTGPTDQSVGTYDQRAAALIEPTYQPYGPYGDYQSFRDAHSKPDGSIDWPPNQGADGPRVVVELPAGTVLDRFGSPNGDFLSPLRPDGQAYGFGERAIMPDSLGKGYHVYVLDAPLTVELAAVAPAFDQSGGARQLQPVLDAALADPNTGKMSVQRLIDLGVLHEVDVPPADGRVLPPDFGTFDRDGNVRTSDPVTVADARDGAFDGYTPADPPASLTPNPDLGPVAHQGPIPIGEVSQRVDQAIRNSQVTDSGVALHTEDRLRDLSSRIPANADHVVLDIHTDGDGVRIGDTHYTRAELVQLITNHPDLADRTIMFVGCDAGAGGENSLAAHVARETGQRVIAPDDLAWSDRDGNVYSSSPNESGTGPKLPPDGGWHAFEPDGTHAPAGENGMPPGHEPKGDLAGDGQEHRGRLDIEPQVQQPWTAPETTHEQHVQLRDDQSFFHSGQDLPRDTRITVRGEDGQVRTVVHVDADGKVHVDAVAPNTRHGDNPEVRHPAPNAHYRVELGHRHDVFVANADGTRQTAQDTIKVGDRVVTVDRAVIVEPVPEPADGRRVIDRDHPLAPRPDEAFTARTDLPPNTRMEVHDTDGTYRGTVQTDADGKPRWVAAPDYLSTDVRNPEVQHTSQGTNYNIDRGPLHQEFTTDANGHPQHAVERVEPTTTRQEPVTGLKQGEPFSRPGQVHDPSTEYLVTDEHGQRRGRFLTDEAGHVVFEDTHSGQRSRVNAEIAQAPVTAQVTSDGFYGLGKAEHPTRTWPTPANGEVELAAQRTKTADGYVYSVKVVSGDTSGWTPEQHAAVTRPFGNADPFAARADLPPNTRFVLDDHKKQGYGTFQTGPDGAASHVHTFRPFSPDLNNPLPNAVLVADNDAWRGRTNGDGETVATTGRPDLKSGGAIRRDGSAQLEVGNHGEVDSDGRKLSDGGHHQGNETGGPGEAANQSSQQRDQNQGNERPAFVTAETWHRMERDRAKFLKSGGTVEMIDTFALRDPLQRHPHTYQTRWRVTLADGTTEIYVRSYPNEHNAALWPADF